MRLVLDANVIIAGPLRDGAVRAAILLSTDELYTPATVAVEIRSHWDEIECRSGLSPAALEVLLESLMARLSRLEDERLLPHLWESRSVMRGLDPDDAPYLAAALAIDGSVVSNDRAFARQQLVPHLWRSEFVDRSLGSDTP